jgi:threonine/homoserine/homoserine lactone efflux protein
MPSTLLAFLGACTLVAASPGPSTVLIIRQSLRSRRSGFLTLLDNETGVLVWGVVAACGLTALLAASELAYDVMRVAGAVVLVVFGIRTLRQARRTKEEPDTDWTGAPRSGWASYRGGLLLNLANPKAAVFEIGFHGTCVWFVGRMKAVLSRAGVRRRLEQVSGGVLLLLGVRMALESRRTVHKSRRRAPIGSRASLRRGRMLPVGPWGTPDARRYA